MIYCFRLAVDNSYSPDVRKLNFVCPFPRFTNRYINIKLIHANFLQKSPVETGNRAGGGVGCIQIRIKNVFNAVPEVIRDFSSTEIEGILLVPSCGTGGVGIHADIKASGSETFNVVMATISNHQTFFELEINAEGSLDVKGDIADVDLIFELIPA